jgi:hypothetical protein
MGTGHYRKLVAGAGFEPAIRRLPFFEEQHAKTGPLWQWSIDNYTDDTRAWRQFIVALAVFLVRVVLILYGPQPEIPSE